MPYTPAAARQSDPETSHVAAATSAARGIGKLHDKWILRELAEMGDGGTGTEIAAAIRARRGLPVERMTNAHVMRRMYRLIAADRVHRRDDPADRRRHEARDGETVHYIGAMPRPGVAAFFFGQP